MRTELLPMSMAAERGIKRYDKRPAVVRLLLARWKAIESHSATLKPSRNTGRMASALVRSRASRGIKRGSRRAVWAAEALLVVLALGSLDRGQPLVRLAG